MAGQVALFIGQYSGNVGIGTADPLATLDVNGSMLVRGTDLFLGRTSTGRGDTGLSRALVKDDGKRLTINYASDFAGGVKINGPQITLNGALEVVNSAKMRRLILNENYEAASENVLNVRGNTPENMPLIFAENKGRGWTFYAHSEHGRHYGNNSSIRMKRQVAPIADALDKIKPAHWRLVCVERVGHRRPGLYRRGRQAACCPRR